MANSSDLTKRMMDAESEANKAIEAQDFHHTASYHKLTESDRSDAFGDSKAGSISGATLHEQLLQRAYVKENMTTNNYRETMLGTNSFRRSAFDAADESTRQGFMSSRADQKKPKDQSGTQRRRGLDAEAHSRTSRLGDSASSRSAGRSSQPHTFKEPPRPRHDPYAA